MARANNNGWDFVKVGESYQYKEDWFIADVHVLEDNSDDDYYKFKLRIDKSSMGFKSDPEPFDISATKKLTGVYSGQLQLYPFPEYRYEPKYKRKL